MSDVKPKMSTLKKVILWIVAIFFGVPILLAILGAIVGDNGSKTAQPQTGTSTPSTAVTAVPLPDDEHNFIAVVERAMVDMKGAANDMQLGGVRAARKNGICSVLKSGRVSNWIGTVKKVGANSDGKGVLEIEISKNIILKTSNNDLSDIGSGTLIDPSSPLFAKAAQLMRGKKVTFSGSLFVESDVDCVKEMSLSLKGSLREPEFLFRFSDITPAP